MSLNATLNSASLGLSAQKAAMQVIGHNIANANTEGYSRQILSLESMSGSTGNQYGQVGLGVRVQGVTRSLDQSLSNQLSTQNTNVSNWDETYKLQSRIEGIVNETANTGLSFLMNDFFGAWQDVANVPDNMGARANLATQASNMSNYVNGVQSNLDQLQRDINSSVESAISEVNRLSAEISNFNTSIQGVESTGQNANDLRDKRDNALNSLANLVDIRYYEQANKQVFVQTANGVSLVAGAGNLTLQGQANGDNNEYKDVMWNDGKDNLTDVTAKMTGGQLGAMIEMRDTTIPGYIEDLDRLSGSMAVSVNELHQQGYDAYGSSGINFFTPPAGGFNAFRTNAGTETMSVSVSNPGTLTRDNYTIQFTSATQYSITNRTNNSVEAGGPFDNTTGAAFFAARGLNVSFAGAATAGDKFIVGSAVDMARDLTVNQSILDNPAHIAASLDGQIGDNGNAQRILQLQYSAEVDNFNSTTGSGTFTFAEYYGSFVTQIGNDTAYAKNSFVQSDSMLTQLKNYRESVSGVSLDQEMADLIRYQQAFSGSAKMISVVNDMLREVANMI